MMFAFRRATVAASLGSAGCLVGLLIGFIVPVNGPLGWDRIVEVGLGGAAVCYALLSLGRRSVSIAWMVWGVVWAVVLFRMEDMVDGDVARTAQILPYQFAAWSLVALPLWTGATMAFRDAFQPRERWMTGVGAALWGILLLVAWWADRFPQEGSFVWVSRPVPILIAIMLFGLAPLWFAVGEARLYYRLVARSDRDGP